MKGWKCPECSKARETENNIVMVICGCCQVAMKPSSYKFIEKVVLKHEEEN